MLLRTVLSGALVFAFLCTADALTSYMTPKRVLPIHDNPAPLLANVTSGNTTLKKIQQLGDLIKWQQLIDNIPVYGSVITTHSNVNGKIDSVQGFIGTSKGLVQVDQIPDIKPEVALSILKVHWNHAGLRNANWIYADPMARLNILQAEGEKDKLVWRTGYFVDWADDARKEEGFGPMPGYIIGLVNAHTGKMEKTWNNLQEIQVKGIVGNDKTGSSMKVMNVQLEPDDDWCRHRHDENRVEAFTLSNKRYLSRKLTKSTFICDRASSKEFDSYAFTGGYSPRNEVFAYGNYFVQLWNKLIGNEIKPYRDSTSDLLFYTHYGKEYDNAFFNGFSFVFGDGNKSITYPLTSLDIVCHEIGHAMTEWHGGDMEYYGEMGGINEAYSDMLAQTCKMYFRKSKDYLIGADIMRPGQPAAMRDMCNPKKFGGLEHYKEYKPGVDVHYSSGIYNKVFCILSKTDFWGYIKTFQVFTKANLMFWGPTTSMHCGACGVESAAKDQKLNVADVQKAFDMVGVSCNLCPKITV